MRVAPKIELSDTERMRLERTSKGRSVSQRQKERSQIILLAAQGLDNKEISVRLGQDPGKVGRWRKRYAELGSAGIEKDKTRPGRIKPLSAATRSKVIKLTLESKPAGSTHWSRSTMAKEAGISESSVGRIWAGNGLKPHRIKSFKLSNDKDFEEKLENIIGLYLSPPEHAIVLSCDEKSQIQALDRTQPGLPLKKGRCETMTHDYKRNGTTSLFAAMDIATGSIIGKCMEKHRHNEWLAFLRLIDKSTPANKEIHIICDNYATHKHERVKAWLKRNRRFNVHFTPTSASWLNMVERFFRDLTDKSVRRGVFRNIGELTQAITDYIKSHNADPKPFIWTATATDILEKVKRGRQKLNNVQSA
ncbi:MAG: IS630 family transposase [Verrucomicrobiaceae bacterium]|nr:MAG: IS630 family transposase [Verrucomicrobiaceae bacterium]